MISQDDRIRKELADAALQMGEEAVSCTVEDGEVILEGAVSTDERSSQLEEVASSIDGVRTVHNELNVRGFGATVEDVEEGVDLIPDFTAKVGTDDSLEAVSEGQPYFPPTDPVVKPDQSTEGLEVVGGFAGTADEDAALAGLPGRPRGDDELRSAVQEALLSDGGTTDLQVEVEVIDAVAYLRGTVASLDDADLAESVAARVPGIEEVREELDVEGM